MEAAEHLYRRFLELAMLLEMGTRGPPWLLLKLHVSLGAANGDEVMFSIQPDPPFSTAVFLPTSESALKS